MMIRTLFPLFLGTTLALGDPLTPEAVSRLALDQNPGLAAARAIIAEAEARASGLGLLPNPEFESAFAAGSHERGRLEIGLTQAFPRTSRLRLERRVAEHTLALARLEIAAAEAETVARARSALVELAAAAATLTLAEQQAALAREFADTQNRQFQAGQLSSLDATQAALLARETELHLAEPRAGQIAAALALATELGREADPALTAALDLSLPAEPPAPANLGARPDLALAEAALTAADAEISLARRAGHEDYRLGVFAEGEQERDALGAREQELKIGLRFSLPLPVRNLAGPAVAEKQAARRRLALQRDALALAARNELAASSAALATRHASARALATELLPAAREYLAAAEAALARGEAEITQVFRAREHLAALERAELAARRAYHLALVQNLAAAGLLLP